VDVFAPLLCNIIIGWIILLGIITTRGILQCYLALVFLVVVPLTSSIAFSIYGSRPRALLVSDSSPYNRLILVAGYMYITDWMAFYGESTIVNSLLNRPLEPKGPKMSSSVSTLLRIVLRILVLGQWALALREAATKNWNSYRISFWVAFIIF
jgi:hypothetical protein